MKLPPQLFLGTEPSAKRLRTPRDYPGRPKPSGGIWTSSYVDGTSGWEEWVRESESEALAGKVRSGRRWLLTPAEARVWVLQEGDDVRRLFAEYGKPLMPGWDPPAWTAPDWLPEAEEADLRAEVERRRAVEFLTLRWERFAAEWDALWLLSPDLDMGDGWPLRLASMLFYGWDCESTWWTRWSFEGAAEAL